VLDPGVFPVDFMPLLLPRFAASDGWQDPQVSAAVSREEAIYWSSVWLMTVLGTAAAVISVSDAGNSPMVGAPGF
jgi:hypothetical protein